MTKIYVQINMHIEIYFACNDLRVVGRAVIRPGKRPEDGNNWDWFCGLQCSGFEAPAFDTGDPAMEKVHYIIRGGVEGRERLRILARVMRPTTLDLLERVGMRAGMTCLEVGCGGGDLSFDMARLVGPEGRGVGNGLYQTQLHLGAHAGSPPDLANLPLPH